MVEIDIHSILRKQKKNPPDKPVEIDWFFDVLLLSSIWAWGMGYTYGEVVACWLKTLFSE
jgi:hypothetical protein